MRISTSAGCEGGKTVVDTKVHNWYMREPVTEGALLDLKGF